MDDLKCVDCGKLPPQTESAYTLIGGKAGWRFTRSRAADGTVTAEWRCPECWIQFRKNVPNPPAQPGSRTSAGTPGPAAGRAPDSIHPGRGRKP